MVIKKEEEEKKEQKGRKRKEKEKGELQSGLSLILLNMRAAVIAGQEFDTGPVRD